MGIAERLVKHGGLCGQRGSKIARPQDKITVFEGKLTDRKIAEDATNMKGKTRKKMDCSDGGVGGQDIKIQASGILTDDADKPTWCARLWINKMMADNSSSCWLLVIKWSFMMYVASLLGIWGFVAD